MKLLQVSKLKTLTEDEIVMHFIQDRIKFGEKEEHFLYNFGKEESIGCRYLVVVILKGLDSLFLEIISNVVAEVTEDKIRYSVEAKDEKIKPKLYRKIKFFAQIVKGCMLNSLWYKDEKLKKLFLETNFNIFLFERLRRDFLIIDDFSQVISLLERDITLLKEYLETKKNSQNDEF